MTLVADSVDETEVVPVAPPPAKSKAKGPVPIVVALVWMLVAFVVCWSLLLLTQGALGNVWFHARQHHLASGILVGEKTVLPGQALGVMQIPAIGLDVVVQEGDDASALRSGPGHHLGTPRPGQIGNSVVVGHREAWGAPFAKLSELKPKDLIVFQNARDTLHNYVFEVRSVVSGVAADDPAPFAHSNDHRLTLVTGSGGRFSDRGSWSRRSRVPRCDKRSSSARRFRRPSTACRRSRIRASD